MENLAINSKNFKWLFEKPIAHRGLHNEHICENSMSAFLAAAENNYNIETDLYLLSDGKIAAFHDQNLKRICGLDAKISHLTSVELKKLKLLDTDESVPLLEELLENINGKTGLLLEFKSVTLTSELEKAAYKILKTYTGNFAVQSFNPYSVRWFKTNAPDILRGQLSGRIIGSRLKKSLVYALTSLRFRKFNKPDFIAYQYEDLPNKYVDAAINEGLKLLTWTVKSNEDAIRAKTELKVDNIIFEGFIPNF